MKFSKGPWSTRGTMELGHRIEIHSEAYDGVTVAEIRHKPGVGESEANARLIAAAPSLLEAGRALVDALGPEGTDPETAIAALRAAVGRAADVPDPTKG